MFEIILDPDVTLRQLEQKDAPALFALMDRHRAYFGQWLGEGYIHKTLAEAERFIHISQLRHEGDLNNPDDFEHLMTVGMFYPVGNGAFDAGIWVNGELAGEVQLHTIDWDKKESDIGYMLAPEHQGRGLMTRAVRAVIDYAFDEYQLERLTISCAVHNLRSRAIPERLGFKLERIIPNAELINGQMVDDALYGIWRYRWRGEPHPKIAARRNQG